MDAHPHTVALVATRPAEVRSCDEASFEAALPHVYGAKIKTLLTGLPLEETELAQLQSDPMALRDLVADWVDRPGTDGKLIALFATALQQDGFVGGRRDSCRDGGMERGTPLLDLEDYVDYRKVRVRAPRAGEETTKFWDLAAERTRASSTPPIP